jgi:hypothetical protein
MCVSHAALDSRPRGLSAQERDAPRYQAGRSSGGYDLETGALILEGARHSLCNVRVFNASQSNCATLPSLPGFASNRR